MSTIVFPTPAEEALDAAIARQVLRGPGLARDGQRRERIEANVLTFLPWIIGLLGLGQALEAGPLDGSSLAVVALLIAATAGLATVADVVVLRRYCVRDGELTA